MLPDWVTPLLRCPATGQRLEPRGNTLVRADGKVFPCPDGIASLVYPEALAADDASWNRFYDALAPFYDFSERVLGRLLTGVDTAKGRAEIVKLASFEPGGLLLEVSPGPGVFLPLLSEALGPGARIAAADLSLNMLRQCRRWQAALMRPTASSHPLAATSQANFLRGLPSIALVHANAMHLPFADDSFDALFHFGGVNLFSDPGRALGEFVRVVRKGGRIVWGDEQMSENFTHPVGRRVLPRINPGFKKTPPAPPDGAEVLARHEVYDGLGYLVVARKTA